MPLRINDLHCLVRMVILSIVCFQDPVTRFRAICHVPDPQPNPSLILQDTCSVLDKLFSLIKLSPLPSPQET